MSAISTNFSRSLSFLRQEKAVSQRQAAQELGVSQALLSHYENGIREPGFSFLLRACDYYHVSTDFLLGRTLVRNGGGSPDPGAPVNEAQSREDNNPSLYACHPVKQSLDLLLSLLAGVQNDEVLRAACHYLSTAIYTLFRHIYQTEGSNSQDLFSVPSLKFSLGAAKMDMLASEMAYLEALLAHARDKGFFPPLSHEALTRDFAAQYQALLTIIHATGERINRQLDDHQNQA